MSLFQKTILRKYLNQQDQTKLADAWQKFQQHFHNPEIQENIRNSKEEQYQAGFLVDLFVKVLGYTINPSAGFNLSTEYKNEKDSKKADGALVFKEKVVAVIELKGTNTTDLSKIEAQAFGYKNNQPECDYVITSNFEKLRFYVDNAIHHLEFNLFKLSREEFELLHLCLHKRNIESGIPKKMKSESIVEEEDVTKKLYKDYSLFKRVLFTNLCERNSQHDQLEVFKKTQKLLDRFLFVFFAEDRGLIPPYSVRRIVREWDTLKELDVDIPLLDRFRQFFGYFNSGYKGKEFEIYAYNGGLFAPDDFLDSIQIDDDLLYEHTVKLADYNFASEVDVNILGHIFENSLNEIDEIKAQIAGENIDKTKTKRKKDGVFYTPKYITKYIVDNTVGKLCEEQKAVLKIDEEEYITDKKRTKPTIKKLADKLSEYREWLLQLTICDPACGSGAFLNQALEFLIAEHRYVDELQAKLFGDALVLTDIENSILENNLFGVDLNEESVEIAKLSLWLRTAQPNRKLNNLNNNIKCGNSLIDDPAVAGEKAFSWEQEFPHVFAKGGFDVIIGNPPYVRVQGLKENYFDQTLYYEKKFQSATGNYDIYALFMEHCHTLININGIVSFILPHKFLVTDFGVGLRKYFVEHRAVKHIIHFGSELIFADASTYTCIIDLTKDRKDKVFFKKLHPDELFDNKAWDKMDYKLLSEANWDLQSEATFDVIEKLKKQPYVVGDVFDKIFQGIATSLDDVYVFEGVDKGNIIEAYNRKFDYHFTIEKELVKPIVGGKEVIRYNNTLIKNYVLFPYLINNGKAITLNEAIIKEDFPLTYKYIKRFEKELRGRERSKMDIDNVWMTYIYPKNLTYFENPKIITREISLGCNMTLDNEGQIYHNTKVYSFLKNRKFEVDIKFYLGILNSKTMWFFLKNTGSEYGGGYFVFKTNYLKPFPLPNIPNNPEVIIDRVDMILNLNKDLQQVNQKFLSLLQSELGLAEVSKTMQKWYELSFADFTKELKKKKLELSLAQKSEWMDFFEAEKKKATEFQQQITQTDQEIDRMVYALYELTEEEIKIVEGV